MLSLERFVAVRRTNRPLKAFEIAALFLNRQTRREPVHQGNGTESIMKGFNATSAGTMAGFYAKICGFAVLFLLALTLVDGPAHAQLDKKDLKCRQLVTKKIIRLSSQFLRVRSDCAVQQAIGTIPSAVNCLESPPPYGLGTGALNVDKRLSQVFIKGQRMTNRIGGKCSTPTRTPAVLDLDELCSPPSDDWTTVLGCAGDIASRGSDVLTSVFYTPGRGTVAPEELECRSALANKLKTSYTGRQRSRADCYWKNAKLQVGFKCTATVAWPGLVELTGFKKADKRMLNQLTTLKGTIDRSCPLDLTPFGMTASPFLADYTAATPGGETFTPQDLFHAASDVLLAEAAKAVGPLHPDDEYCGDGIVNGAEQCDDGVDTISFQGCDGCNRDCRVTTFCTDGTACGPLETCDDGNFDNADGCNSSCQLEFCGDGVIQDTIGEACDDGNQIDCDGCDSNCTFSNVCSNGIACSLFGEACDDGVGFCIFGYDELRPCIQQSDCGGVCQTGPETGGRCFSNDDCGGAPDENECKLSGGCGGMCSGGALNGELCILNSDCPGACTPITGQGDPCNVEADCAPGMLCNQNQICQLPTLNDPCEIDGDCGIGGVCIASNGCNAGNSDEDPDTCRNSCVLPFCGDGVTDISTDTNGFGGETCDDANTTSGDGCDANCTPTGCNNGIVTDGEVCDLGPGMCVGGTDDGETCVTLDDCRGFCFDDPSVPCTQETAILLCNGTSCVPPSGCVGGNADGIGCRFDCQVPSCGDGVIDVGEQCDQGSGVCVGGASSGEQCSSSAQCPGACESGPTIGNPCASDAECGGGVCGPTGSCDGGNSNDPGSTCSTSCTSIN